jgi:hypothetical protein
MDKLQKLKNVRTPLTVSIMVALFLLSFLMHCNATLTIMVAKNGTMFNVQSTIIARGVNMTEQEAALSKCMIEHMIKGTRTHLATKNWLLDLDYLSSPVCSFRNMFIFDCDELARKLCEW